MKTILMLVTFLVTTSVFANSNNLTDESGEGCVEKASRISKQYFDVADTKEQVGFTVLKDDTVSAVSFKNTTPGSYDQTFISVVKIKIDRDGNAYRPKDQKVKVVFSGDFDCDNLKVKEVSRLGGVERND
ncbi:hypothetical protein SHI21_19345 [Bacteriovorax sp. PP10]|uniref:Uncharacterized protein n=1 Tax=Bacteriovorax antarcticus TaxID=3088717 RepID=A0ABU5W2D6_9BACT|nr:hypothetical protein [Bacteriovorax sp. PP10]MEA9358400.1 hypothetical protein [Bacteriovorax sp. PP10]